MRYYKPVENKDGIIYSCDMLRLRFKTRYISNHFGQGYAHIPMGTVINRLRNEMYEVKQYISATDFRYKYLYTFSRGDEVLTLGLEQLNPHEKAIYNMVEFNPNKVDAETIRFVLAFLRRFSSPHVITGARFELVRWDLAVDIPTERCLLKLLRKGRRQYKYVVGTDGSITEYVGNRNTNGFVKLYDKQKESKLPYALSRVEITVDGPKILFPELYLKQYQQELDLDLINKTDRVLVEMLRRLDEEETQYWFRQLGRSKQDKLRQYVFQPERMFQFDMRSIAEVRNNIDDIIRGEIEGGGLYENNSWNIESGEQCTSAAYQSNASGWSEISDKDVELIFRNGKIFEFEEGEKEE